MTLNINDTVLYGTDGVCKVTGKIKKEFHGKSMEYYVLKSEYVNNYVIYVPVNGKNENGKIRSILSLAEVNDLIKNIQHEESDWISDDATRKSTHQEMLNSGDRSQLITMMKTIYQHGEERKKLGKRLHIADEHCMKEAEKILCEEFAHVLDIRPDQVMPFIREKSGANEKSTIQN